MEFLKPKRLQVGDTVAAISLSDGAAGLFPHVYETARKNLKQIFGLKVLSTPHALKDPDWIYKNPQARAEDLHWALENPEVKGIFSNIGGYESVRILPYLNHDLIAKHPKLFMGFSDSTIQLMTFLNAGVVSFQGPSMMAGIVTLKAFPYMQESIRQTLFEGYTGLLKPAPFWNETNLDWAESEYAARAHLPLNVHQGEGWLWLQGSVNAEGHLVGGCIEVLEMLKGTRWWPKPAMFKKAVLYLETSNDVPPPANVEYWLRNYASQGILNEISALFLARARDYTPAMKDQLHTSVLKVLAEVGREEMPVIANMDIGHTMPMMVLPNGCKVFIDAKKKEISLLEAGVI